MKNVRNFELIRINKIQKKKNNNNNSPSTKNSYCIWRPDLYHRVVLPAERSIHQVNRESSSFFAGCVFGRQEMI